MDNEEKTQYLKEQKNLLLKRVFLCRNCQHRNVCKYLQEKDGQVETCKDFLSVVDYKTYGNIYNFFQPIFDWLNCHYPSCEVKFIVDNFGATMYLEHGVFVPNKGIKSALCLSNEGKSESNRGEI